jgi:hypothetical protein
MRKEMLRRRVGRRKAERSEAKDVESEKVGERPNAGAKGD